MLYLSVCNVAKKRHKNVSTTSFHVKPDLCKLANKCQITIDIMGGSVAEWLERRI